MVKQMPKTKMPPRSQYAGKYKMGTPEVGINVQKGFPVPQKRKRF